MLLKGCEDECDDDEWWICSSFTQKCWTDLDETTVI